MRGKKPQELIPPCELPELLVPIWQDFLNLNQTRQVGMAAQPISYLEMDAYCRMTQRVFSRLEVSIIKRLDALVLEILSKG